MKSILITIALMPAALFAELSIPSSVFTMKELSEAQAKANSKKEPLIFVYTDPGTTWGACIATSSEAFKSFNRVGTVVFVHSKKDEWGSLPKGAQEMRKKSGNTIPMVFVTSPDGATGIEGIPYKNLHDDMRKSIRDLKKTLEEAPLEGGEIVKTDPAPSPTTDSTPAREGNEYLTAEQEWTNSDGKSMKAAVRSVNADEVVFEMAGGKIVKYPLLKLSPKSRETLDSLK